MDQFPGQQEGEQPKLVEHRHWMFMLPDIFALIIAVAAPILVLVVANVLGAELSEEPAANFVAVLVPVYYLAVATWFFIRWLDFYLDLAVITNQRLVDIDQHGLFRRNTAELQFDAVQDVSSDRSGMLPTFFNFGDVTIQTAGERANFVFRTVPRPDDIVNIIHQAQREAGSGGNAEAEKMAHVAQVLEEVSEKLDPNAQDDQSSDTNQETSQSSAPTNDSADATSDQSSNTPPSPTHADTSSSEATAPSPTTEPSEPNATKSTAAVGPSQAPAAATQSEEVRDESTVIPPNEQSLPREYER